MKIKIITASIIAMFVMLLVTVAYATTPKVELKTDVTQIKKGETFTVTLSATSEDGINGIDTTYTYNSQKLELISEELVDSTNWNSIATSPNITIICNSMQKIEEADIYKLTFKVKDNVSVGDVLKIETSSILLDTDATTNSEVTISAQKVEVTVIEQLEINFQEYNEVKQDGNNYLKDILPSTTLENFVSNIQTNGTIKIYKNNEEVTNNNLKVSTGMKVVITLNDESYEYTMVVKGDTTGDGDSNLTDLLLINKYRLNKISLSGAYLLAGDVNKDNSVDLKDILQINKFRLGKIDEL